MTAAIPWTMSILTEIALNRFAHLAMTVRYFY